MPASILGISRANGDWHGFGSSGWWIETDGPFASQPTRPNAYDVSLPGVISSVSAVVTTDNLGQMAYSPSDTNALRLSSGYRNTYVAAGCSEAGDTRITVAATGSYRGLIRLTEFSAGTPAGFQIFKSDGTTTLGPGVFGLTLAPGLWIAWEADETVVLRLTGRYKRYQGILFDPPRRAWLID